MKRLSFPSAFEVALTNASNYSKLSVRLGVFVALIGIGIVSFLAGTRFTFSLLYLIPILALTWREGFFSGAIAAVFATALWLTGDTLADGVAGVAFTNYWNALMRLGTFLVASALVAATRSLNLDLELRVATRTTELERQIQENRDLERSILEISDAERFRIGQDLHDEVCQQLVCAAFSVQILEGKLLKTQPDQVPDVLEIGNSIDEAITEIRNLVRGLFPVRLISEGLVMAVQEFASNLGRRYGLECVVVSTGSPVPLPIEVGIHLYRIIQEAATNAAKHSGSQSILISINHDSGSVALSVTDAGSGFNRSQADCAQMGLKIMDYRSKLLGAEFTIDSRENEGSKVVCKLELKASHHSS